MIQRQTRCRVCSSTQDEISGGMRRCAGCLGAGCTGTVPKMKQHRCLCGELLRPTGRESEYRCQDCRRIYEMTSDVFLCDDRPERNAEKKEEFEKRKRDNRRKQAARV